MPACAFAACFDASLALVCAHEAECEAADDGHVFGAVSGSITRQVVAEFDIEHPMHALDAPMAAGASAEALDVQRCGRDIMSGVEAAPVVVFGAAWILTMVLMLAKRG